MRTLTEGNFRGGSRRFCPLAPAASADERQFARNSGRGMRVRFFFRCPGMVTALVADELLVEEVGEWFGQRGVAGVFVVDPQLREDGLVEQAALLVAGGDVGGLDVVHEIEGDVKGRRSS